jgi:membrane protein implicated in regulation of membrane protease activity
MLWATWWVWAVAGLVLAILEVLLPGFVLLGFALGALTVAGFLLIADPSWIPGPAGLGLGFALASGLAWLALRRLFRLRGEKPKIWRRDINDT